MDFAHTGGEGRYAVFETLHEPADLSEWLAQPPLAAVMTVPVTTRELTAAKALRQAIWDAAHARAVRRPLPAGAVATINRAALWAYPRVRERRLPAGVRDSSRPGARRWCAMERCGNRHKLRALRARRATDP